MDAFYGLLLLLLFYFKICCMCALRFSQWTHAHTNTKADFSHAHALNSPVDFLFYFLFIIPNPVCLRRAHTIYFLHMHFVRVNGQMAHNGIVHTENFIKFYRPNHCDKAFAVVIVVVIVKSYGFVRVNRAHLRQWLRQNRRATICGSDMMRRWSQFHSNHEPNQTTEKNEKNARKKNNHILFRLFSTTCCVSSSKQNLINVAVAAAWSAAQI